LKTVPKVIQYDDPMLHTAACDWSRQMMPGCNHCLQWFTRNDALVAMNEDYETVILVYQLFDKNRDAKAEWEMGYPSLNCDLSTPFTHKAQGENSSLEEAIKAALEQYDRFWSDAHEPSDGF